MKLLYLIGSQSCCFDILFKVIKDKTRMNLLIDMVIERCHQLNLQGHGCRLELVMKRQMTFPVSRISAQIRRGKKDN